MIVAEIVVTSGARMMTGFAHPVPFNDLAAAKAEFDRVADFLKRREERTNDLPKLVVITGSGHEISIPLSDIHSIGLVDYAVSNEERKGMKDSFPNMFK